MIPERPRVGLPSIISGWVNESCLDCGFPKLAIVSLRGEPEITEKVCVSCGASCGGVCLACNLECLARQKLVPDNVSLDYIAKAGGYSTEHNIVFGKNIGTIGGLERARQLGFAVRRSNPQLKPGDPAFMEPYRALQNAVSVSPKTDPPYTKSCLEMMSTKIEKVEQVRGIKIPENLVDNLAKLVRKGLRKAKVRPRTKKARRALVEDILQMRGLWPP